jgi:hypothetical protein
MRQLAARYSSGEYHSLSCLCKSGILPRWSRLKGAPTECGLIDEFLGHHAGCGDNRAIIGRPVFKPFKAWKPASFFPDKSLIYLEVSYIDYY